METAVDDFPILDGGRLLDDAETTHEHWRVFGKIVTENPPLRLVSFMHDGGGWGDVRLSFALNDNSFQIRLFTHHCVVSRADASPWSSEYRRMRQDCTRDYFRAIIP